MMTNNFWKFGWDWIKNVGPLTDICWIIYSFILFVKRQGENQTKQQRQISLILISNTLVNITTFSSMYMDDIKLFWKNEK